MAKKNKRTPEDDLVDFIGEEITAETSIIAAAINLVYAGNIAKENNSVKDLLRVAESWNNIARFLGSVEDPNEEKNKSASFGFGALENINDPGNEPDEGESGIEVRSKSW